MAIQHPVHHPVMRRAQLRGWRVLATRRRWVDRFLQPNDLFGLKVTLLLLCYLLSAMLRP